MTAFVGGVFLAIAISGAAVLFVWMFPANRACPPSLWKTAATALLVLIAVWQVYLLLPRAGTYLAYSLLPLVAGGFLFVFFWNLRVALKHAPTDGPDAKIPAVAKRLGKGLDMAEDREGHQKIA